MARLRLVVLLSTRQRIQFAPTKRRGHRRMIGRPVLGVCLAFVAIDGRSGVSEGAGMARMWSMRRPLFLGKRQHAVIPTS